MAKPTKETIKMLAISTCIGTVIRTAEASELRLITLNMQIEKALRVFHAKAGSKLYFGTAQLVATIWLKLQDKHETTVTQDKLSVFIELLSQLVPPQHFKMFLAVAPYQSKVEIDDATRERLGELAKELDDELNEVFGTKPYTYVEPKPKAPKVKRERDKKVIKPKIEKVSRNKLKRAKEEKDRKDKALPLLKDKLAGILNR